MSVLTRWFVPALAAAGICMSAGQVLAERPSCESLAAERAAGHTVADIAQTHGVTGARVEACTRSVEQREQQAARRSDKKELRIQRAALQQR